MMPDVAGLYIAFRKKFFIKNTLLIGIIGIIALRLYRHGAGWSSFMYSFQEKDFYKK